VMKKKNHPDANRGALGKGSGKRALISGAGEITEDLLNQDGSTRGGDIPAWGKGEPPTNFGERKRQTGQEKVVASRGRKKSFPEKRGTQPERVKGPTPNVEEAARWKNSLKRGGRDNGNFVLMGEKAPTGHLRKGKNAF